MCQAPAWQHPRELLQQSPPGSSARVQSCCCCLALAALVLQPCPGRGWPGSGTGGSSGWVPAPHHPLLHPPPSKADVRDTSESLCTPPGQQRVGFFLKTSKQKNPQYFNFCILFSHCRCNLRFAAAGVAAAHTGLAALAAAWHGALPMASGQVPAVASSCAGTDW